MAEIVAGVGCSHAPSIAHAYDRKLTEEPGWKPLFQAFERARRWLMDQRPDVLVVIYNDHIDQFWLDSWPTFSIGVADEFEIADEGWGPRAFPPVPGYPSLARHLAQELVRQDFDLTVAQRQVVDHGVLAPLPLLDEGWAVPIIPIGVNVIMPPLPTPARCWALGEALGRAVRSYPDAIRVAVVGTGGLSHQLTGPEFGAIRPEWDVEFLHIIEHRPQDLCSYTMDDFARLGGDHAVEVVQWMAMRAALPDSAKLAMKVYYPHAIMGYAIAAFRA